LLRYLWIRANSPLLFSSGALKNEKPQYREIKVAGGSIASLEMKEISNVEKTANFTPGCRSVALRAKNGQYVCAVGGGGWEVVANRDQIKEWETFELIQLDDGGLALRSHNGQYLMASTLPGGRILAHWGYAGWIGHYATFKLIGVGADQVALLAHNGKYVCAEGGGGRELLANRTAIGPWETFTLIELEKAGQVALQSFNYPDHFIRHRNRLGEISVVGTDMDRKDATFRIVPGLAENQYPSLQKEYISLQSVNYPGYYLRHQNYTVKLHKYSDDDLFKKDATFRLIPGLADRTWSSLESLNYPGFCIRHKDFKLNLGKGNGDLFRKDATFKILSPPWQ